MKKVFLAAAIAVGILAAGCSKETTKNVGEEGTGILTITLRNANDDGSRSIGPDPTVDQENMVNNFMVFVFNSSSGSCEAQQEFKYGDDAIIYNLSTASRKKVVALVNYDFTNMPTVTDYDDLDAMALNIDSQIPDFIDNFLFMSGETDGIQLVANETTQATVNVDRVVAKVRLASLTVSPTAGSDLSLLQIEGISMQKVPYWAYMLGDYTYEVDPAEPHTYVGGIAGGNVSVEVIDYLHNAYTLPAGYTTGQHENPRAYYYVFPNDAVQNEATLLTIYGKYDGKDAYYTFPINDKDLSGTGGNTTDGTFIKRNMIYNLNVTLSNLVQYADNPDAINEFGHIQVTITVQPWAGTLTQNVTW